MDRKTTGILAYITLVGLIIALVAGDKEGAKFHINQAFVLMLAGIIGGFAVGIVAGVFGALGFGAIGSLLSSAFGVAMLVFWIIGIVNAANDVEKELPVIGGIRIIK